MSERKLATIQVIENITPIQNADKIEVAHILGWECVVKKDEFKIGEKVIYCEVDSVMPDKPEYEFLRERKFRIRTIKLRGQISQGLVLPLSVLNKNTKAIVDCDVTDIIGITKYLSPSERKEEEDIERQIQRQNKVKRFMMRYSWFRKLFLSRKQKSGFPFWVNKTDEPRIQNLPHILEQFAEDDVYITEKIDYQSTTFTGQLIPKYSGLLGRIIKTKKYKFVVCSRNLTTNDKNSLYWQIAKQYHIEDILNFNPHLTIQGEQGNTKVQGNKYGIKENKFWVFNIINHATSYQYNYNEMVAFCERWGLTPVPLIKECKIKDIGTTVSEWVDYAKGQSVLANVPREGVVVRSIKNGQKLLSFKVINNEFLLKYEN